MGKEVGNLDQEFHFASRIETDYIIKIKMKQTVRNLLKELGWLLDFVGGVEPSKEG
ncbi:hypothetical protein RND71_036998 [Anisodus tanguticus]|uniref:Uncharacterized protein n=1 Tax=Anisodus tanguticus TaxID=243964 RepID=A0AAE1R1H9_9SOLA|nr:hypothetical protein RND71_036998 [Anisodus tanguticus]